MSKQQLALTGKLVCQDFEMPLHQDFISEEELLEALTQRVAYLMQHQLEQLFTALYRLDVSEAKVHAALQVGEEPQRLIAKLIIEREKQKAYTRLKYNQESQKDDEVEGW